MVGHGIRTAARGKIIQGCDDHVRNLDFILRWRAIVEFSEKE